MAWDTRLRILLEKHRYNPGWRLPGREINRASRPRTPCCGNSAKSRRLHTSGPQEADGAGGRGALAALV